MGGRWSFLCPEHAIRPIERTIETILIYQNDPDVGGPDDPLDNDDYRTLKDLGLWPNRERD